MGEELKVIVFTLAHEQYGVEVEFIETIERIQPMTRVPKTPPFVKGVINLRGIVVPVIDLRSRFGLKEAEYTNDSRIIIVAIKEMKVGLIVDSASDVVDMNSDTIVDPPEIVGGIRAKYLRGVAKLKDERLLVMLNLQEVLNKSEIVQLEQIEE